ncbi:helix-turn-helix domain-containing protein [Streptomyces sp. NBC_01190]|uniref:helix-turn-helix domain-containing protein n=1 Tax=Streptomyces sp. NBC_01190 TaxID=2903767 RepID=UPI003864B9BE|nr:helix-turn-helix transcriptional regulator [Streptomyces sp. NBC_01190]
MNESFGQALKRLRGSRSVRDVAQLANCSKSLVSDLENGKRKPTPQSAAAVDRALGAQGELTALADATSNPTPLDQADALQRGLHETLAAGPLSDAGLDEVEWTVTRHGRATRYRPESELLPDLIADFSHLRLLMTGRQSVPVRRRLTIAAARMSGLVALTLLKLGDERSKSWWRTGRTAAAAAEDRATLSWIYAQAAYQLYYNGDLYGAVELAIRAQQCAGAFPCVGPALAAPLEARAHAQLSRRDATASALSNARTALDRLPEDERQESAFGYSEAQFAFHSGNAWTHLEDTSRAGTELAQALHLCPKSDHTDRALVRLDQAMCAAISGHPASAADQAMSTVVELPEQHRSALIIFRAREVADKVPEARKVLEMKALREILALPSE